MKLQEIFDQLSGGEFSQLSIGGREAGVIDYGNYSRVLGHVNLGLNALFRRFSLKEGRMVLAIQAGVTSYKLDSSYAVNGTESNQAVRYILDSSVDPFTDDIIKVEGVLTAAGLEMGLNDAADPYSVFTPSALVLRVPDEVATVTRATPDWLKTTSLTVIYRAGHPRLIATEEYDPATVEVELPDTHLEPLLYYVASRVNNPVGMNNEFHAGNSYFAKYEAACQALEGKGLQVDQGSQNTGLSRGGWV
jgi:hypothetical protein